MKNNDSKDFEKYAIKHMGINSLSMHDYKKKTQPRAMTPYIMEERQMNVSQVDVFSRLMMERIIWLAGPVEDFNSTVIQAQLMYLESVDPKKDISIHVDSPGGSVNAGKKIISIMEYISSDVATICTGMAASMGAVILAAGKKGKRSSLKYSKVMIHASSGGVGGNIHDARIMMAEWEKENEELFEMLGGYCGKTTKQVHKDAERDKWLTPTESKEYGLIDFVIQSKKKK
jgi:ATP-dependent Clp protease protease subunit